MSRTRRFVGGAGVGYLNQAVMTVAGIWVTRFLLGRLGAHEYGLWILMLQVLGYLLLADFGVVALLPRETAYAAGRPTAEASAGIADLVGRAVRIVFWQVPIVALAAVVMWFLLPANWSDLRGPIVPVLVAFVALFPLRVFSAVLQGLQDLAFVGLVQLASWTATTLTSVALVLAGQTLAALAVGWITGQLLYAALCWLRLQYRFPGVLPRSLPALSWPAGRAYLAKSVWVSVNQVAQVLLVGSDLVIIGALLGPAAVVPYACTSKLVSVIRNQPLMFVQGALPGLSEMKVSESKQRLADVTSALMLAALALSGAAACSILLANRWFVSWWVGAENYGGTVLTVLLIGNMLIRHVLGSVVVSVFAFGHERLLALVILADGLASVAGGILLVRLLGSAGAPLALLGSAALISVPLLFRVYGREVGVSAWSGVKPVVGLGMRFASILVPALVLVWLHPLLTFGPVIAATVASTILCTLLLVPVARREPLSHYVPRQVAKVLERLPGGAAAVSAQMGP